MSTPSLSQLSHEEREIILAYRKLSPAQAIAVHAYFVNGDNRPLLSFFNQGVHKLDNANPVPNGKRVQ